jgi:hypothetical protein
MISFLISLLVHLWGWHEMWPYVLMHL